MDCDGIAECITAAYSKYDNVISDLPPVSEGIADEVANNQVWVVVEALKIIACLFLVPKIGFMKLANLAVLPSHGGKGLARKLMELAESEARRQGYNEMQLVTHVAMPENVQLYQHLGWHEVSRSGNAVSMKKQL